MGAKVLWSPNRTVDQQPLSRSTETALGPQSTVGISLEKMFGRLLINTFINARTVSEYSIIKVQMIEVPLYHNLINELLRVV